MTSRQMIALSLAIAAAVVIGYLTARGWQGWRLLA